MVNKLHANQFNIAIEKNQKIEIKKVDGWTFEIFDITFGLHYYDYDKHWTVTDLITGYTIYSNKDKVTAILNSMNRVFKKAEFKPLYIKVKKETIEDLKINDIETPVN